ncbi:hypothetical protein Tco_0296752 [Tanacetum coccineum]
MPTSETSAITLAAIRQLVVDSVATALKAQAANMANTVNTNKNTGTSRTPLDDKLNYVEESVEIMDREVKQLRRKCIPIVKVRWNSEFTWEREDQIRAKYPHLFSNIIVSLN